jgi:hypothetical protein
MLSSAQLRRTIACLGIAAAGAAPLASATVLAFFGSSSTVQAASTTGSLGDPIPDIDPEDVEDGTGGIGDPDWPVEEEEEETDPEDVEDVTGGIGGGLP